MQQRNTSTIRARPSLLSTPKKDRANGGDDDDCQKDTHTSTKTHTTGTRDGGFTPQRPNEGVTSKGWGTSTGNLRQDRDYRTSPPRKTYTTHAVQDRGAHVLHQDATFAFFLEKGIDDVGLGSTDHATADEPRTNSRLICATAVETRGPPAPLESRKTHEPARTEHSTTHT